ncbi:MAG UNVERIFIED_CONTAM: hypothetical protein LVR18_50985 [Planctomycetaceae bacterium]
MHSEPPWRNTNDSSEPAQANARQWQPSPKTSILASAKFSIPSNDSDSQVHTWVFYLRIMVLVAAEAAQVAAVQPRSAAAKAVYWEGGIRVPWIVRRTGLPANSLVPYASRRI